MNVLVPADQIIYYVIAAYGVAALGLGGLLWGARASAQHWTTEVERLRGQRMDGRMDGRMEAHDDA